MAQRSSRKRRKERQRAHRDVHGEPDAATPSEDDGQATMARGYARGRQKDEEARAALRPLRPGERPLAVTAAGIVALAFGLINLSAYLAGQEIQGERPSAIGVGLFTFVMLVAAYGCFRVRYWAVLGVQALLGLLIVIFSVVVIGAANVVTLLICLAVIVPSGVLFWYLVKAMARIQMPERPGAR